MRDRGAAEELGIGRAQRLVTEGLVADALRRADALHETVDHAAHDAGLKPAQECDLAAAHQGLQPGGQLSERVVPADRGQHAVLAALHGSAETGRVVGALQAGLTAHAQRAGVRGIRLESIDLDRAAFARLHGDAAAGRALTTQARVEGRNAGDDLFGLVQVRDDLLDGLLARSRDRGARGQARDLQEVASVELRHGRCSPSLVVT